MTPLSFVKYQRAGNDFVLIDAREIPGSEDLVGFSRAVCDRRKGVGADGVLILQPSAKADCKIQIFNADGSKPSMCGNGAYCAVDYLTREQPEREEWTLETAHAVLSSYFVQGRRVLNLGPVTIHHFPIVLLEHGPCYVVNTGVPHAVIFVEALQSVHVDRVGRAIRRHPAFATEGVNVNFVCARRAPKGKVYMRTYERGIEGETLACGTGAAAVAYVVKALYGMKDPISIFSRRDFTSFPLQYDAHLFFSFVDQEIEMSGEAHQVFSGSIVLSGCEKLCERS